MQPPLRSTRPTGRKDPPSLLERLSDPILVERANDGDGRALQVLCQRHAPRVERLARHCVKVRGFRGESAFGTWLHRLTVNASRDVAQRQVLRRCERFVEDERVSADPDPVHHTEAAELRAELGACLATIAPAQAKVAVLKDALDFSFAEIAGAEGMPVGTAKCYAHRGRLALSGRLSA